MQNNGYVNHWCANQQISAQCDDSIPSKVSSVFSSRVSRSTYNEMNLMTNEYDSGAAQLTTESAGQPSLTEESSSSLPGSLQQVIAKTVRLIASNDTSGKNPRQEPKAVENIGIQEEGREDRDQKQTVTAVVEISRNQEESSQENEQVLDTERQPISIPVQESPRPVCSHYQRRCLVRFPCCGKFYPCHRCHNESEDCSDDQARANNATDIRCTICYHEQVVRCYILFIAYV